MRRPRIGEYIVQAINGRPRTRLFRAYARALVYAKTLRLATIDRKQKQGVEPISTVLSTYVRSDW